MDRRISRPVVNSALGAPIKTSSTVAARWQVVELMGRALRHRLERRQSIGQFVRFVGVGIVATGIQFALLLVLMRSSTCGPVFASSIGYAAGAVANYLLNFSFTFRGNNPHHVAAIRFMVVCATGLGGNATLMFLLVHELHIAAVLAQAISLALITVWNFLLHRAWTYGAS